ncbi:putative nucleotidyltransferase, ribonuclease H [Tanacetum coccineum]|uniref:Nucleotidyltransferase, ribonuclease H n=1 Tax=Tanacetum coccineum TaxID=301880 RepID=A0ABQ4Z0R1_9ASTR
MEEPVLRLPDVTMPFELHTDASDFSIGGVLMQYRHPIAFESQKLNETERKYTVQEKEMTAVVHCLRILIHYLLGSRFMIKTDNIATSYFQTQKKLNWGRLMCQEDHSFSERREDTEILAQGRHAGHPGIKRTLALVMGTNYWPRIEDDVETFVRTWLICQQDKIEQKKSGGFLEPLPNPKGPWESVSMDFITCLPKSEGSGSIIVVILVEEIEVGVEVDLLMEGGGGEGGNAVAGPPRKEAGADKLYTAKSEDTIQEVAKKEFVEPPSDSNELFQSDSNEVPWSNERPLKNKELNVIIGAWFTLWRD